MTLARDSDHLEAPGGGSSPFAAVSVVRTLVVRMGGPEAAQQLGELAAMRGHEVRLTQSPEECYWLVATGAVDLLLVTTQAGRLEMATDLLERVRLEDAAEAMHLLTVLEGRDAGAIAALVEAGSDDFFTWPSDKGTVELRLRLAEESLKRRESSLRVTQDLRQAEERFENVFHESPYAVLIVQNDDGMILEANRKVERILGYERGILKGTFMGVLFPELFEDAEGLLSEKSWVKRGEPVEVRYRNPQVGLTYVEVEAMEVPWGDSPELMIRVADVQLRRELEQEQIKASKAESIRLLAGGVAHDFNNILTAICGNLGLISQHSFLPPESRELLNRAEGACERARSLAEQLATFSRHGELATGLRDLGALLKKSVHFALYAGKAKPEFYLPGDLWPVYCDASQLSQVVANLALNADEAMSERDGGGKLQIACTNVSVAEGTRLPLRPGDYVRVSFKDEGPGIPPEDIFRIFDPYFSTRSELTGLGLATASTIIRNHRGYLRAESVPGDGALFEFFLPALSDPAMLDVARDEDGESDDISRTRVLFMDDEEEIRDVVDKVLSRYGFQVYCAADGREAIDVYEKSREFGEPFNVLLFDLDVRGGLGGREAIQHLRKKHPHIKALVTSGYSDDKILENHREAGFSGVISKPFRIDRLVAAVTELAKKSAG